MEWKGKFPLWIQRLVRVPWPVPGQLCWTDEEGATHMTGDIPGGQRVGSGFSGRGEEAKNWPLPLCRGCLHIMSQGALCQAATPNHQQ